MALVYNTGKGEYYNTGDYYKDDLTVCIDSDRASVYCIIKEYNLGVHLQPPPASTRSSSWGRACSAAAAPLLSACPLRFKLIKHCKII